MRRTHGVFDIIGPIMIGPSSSHTAGAVRLGRLSSAILGERPIAARIGLHGSFATTGHGHGTDLALTAGLLGMEPDDARIPDAPALASETGLVIEFHDIDLGDAHPNTATLELEGASGATVFV